MIDLKQRERLRKMDPTELESEFVALSLGGKDLNTYWAFEKRRRHCELAQETNRARLNLRPCQSALADVPRR